MVTVCLHTKCVMAELTAGMAVMKMYKCVTLYVSFIVGYTDWGRTLLYSELIEWLHSLSD